MTIDDLKQRFLDARAINGYGRPPEQDGVCRYCGKWWRKWAGSKLDGHSACIVPQVFKDELKQFIDGHAGISIREISAAIGITPPVIRSWLYPIRGR